MMRIRTLKLRRFGMFTDKVIEFGRRPERELSDFHIIYGDNEAGKTTLMEGYLRLLYGFPLREPYDHLHQRANLRVGAEIELNGEDQTVTRLPTRQNNLTVGQQYLSEDFFGNILGGLGEADYRKLYCLDDKTIEEGGDEITTGKGQIGRLLFGAASGISNVTKLLDKVREEADQLYKFRGSTQRMQYLKRERDNISRKVESERTSATKYKTVRKELTEAKKAEKTADQKRRRLLKEAARLKCISEALPKLTDIAELSSSIAASAHYPDMISIDRNQLETMIAERARQSESHRRLAAEIERVEAQIKDISLDPDRLRLGDDLQTIEDLRSRFVTANEDIPKRQEEMNQIAQNIRHTAVRLGLPPNIENSALVLNIADFSDISQKCSRLNKLSIERSRVEHEIATLNKQIEDTKATFRHLEEGVPCDEKVTDILDQNDIPSVLANYRIARQQIQEANGKAERTLNALMVRGRKFTTVPFADLTSIESRRMATELAEWKKEEKRERDRRAEIQRELAAADSQIDQLRKVVGLRIDSEVVDLKAARDTKWADHKSALTAETAEVFEKAMFQYDQVQAIRIENATSLGKIRQLEEQSRDLQVQIKTIEEKLTRLATAINEQEQRMVNVSLNLKIDPPLTPEGLIDWLEKVDAARESEDHRLSTEHKHAATLAHTNRLRDQLVAAMPQLKDEEDFTAIASVAMKSERERRDAARELAKEQGQRDQLRRSHTRQTKELKRCLEQHSCAAQAIDTWTQNRFGNSVDHSILEKFIEGMSEIQTLDSQRRDLNQRIKSMEADQARFRKSVKEISHRFGVEVIADDPLEWFKTLRETTAEAQEATNSYEELTGKLKDLNDELSQVSASLQDHDAKFKSLTAQFPPSIKVESLQDLSREVANAQGIIAKRQTIRQLTKDVCTKLDVPNLEAARAEVADCHREEITVSLAVTEADSQKADEEYFETVETRTRLQTQLDNVTDDDGVAVLVEKVRNIDLEMKETAQEYLRLHFGHQLAEEAIRRFSEKHRSSMLKATETAFSSLTGGNYQRLQTEPQGHQEILFAIDRTNASKRADDLSKGTRFQLYLALRAAAYEHMASTGRILPFFCDDVFETFDDTRTRAACTLMDRIGRTGQAIYLTHHRHVVDIAQEVCGDVQVHTL